MTPQNNSSVTAAISFICNFSSPFNFELITLRDIFSLSLTLIGTSYMWYTLLWANNIFWTILPLIETTIVDGWCVDAWFMDGVYVDGWCMDEWWIIYGHTMLMCGHMLLMCFIIDNPHQKNFFLSIPKFYVSIRQIVDSIKASTYVFYTIACQCQKL